MQKLKKILKEIDTKIAGCIVKKLEVFLERQDNISNHMNDGWIPVDEVLPEDGQTVLCTDGEYVYLVEYDADLDSPFGELDNITHWQPSPEPYREE